MIDKIKRKELKEKFNPEGSQLRNLQLRLLDILVYFDSFCKTHNIKYWLSSGTLLGAIRHNGFIPWDDDVDIEMLSEDYKIFSELREDFENERFVLQDHQSDKEYISPSPKLRDKASHIKEIHNRDLGYKYDGLFVDIFIRERSSFLSARISHILQYLTYFITSSKNSKFRRISKKVLYNFIYKCICPPLHYLDNLFVRKNSLSYTLGSGFYDTQEKDCIFPLSKHFFEGYEFPVPHNSDGYLRVMYGDYLNLPPLDSIRIHTTKAEF